jgi:hypothetical protein
MRYHDRRWRDENVIEGPRWPLVLGLIVWVAFCLAALSACESPTGTNSSRVFDNNGRELVPVSAQWFQQQGGRTQYPIAGDDRARVWIVAEDWR